MNGLQALTAEQLKFFEKHYVVLDPKTQTTHRDFSKLGASRVIVIGEMHHNVKIYAMQKRAVEILAPRASCALLLEGTAPGQATRRPYYDGLPEHIAVRGSDNRIQAVPLVDQTFHEKIWRVVQKEHEFNRCLKVCEREGASIFNRALEEGRASIDDGRLVLSFDETQKVEKIRRDCTGQELAYNEAMKEYGEWDNQVTQLPGIRVRASNEGLCKEILAAQEERIIAIWGHTHLWCGEEMFRQLEEHKFSYMALIPKASRMIGELKWDVEADQLQLPFLAIEEGKGITLGNKKIPYACKDYYCAPIRNLMVSKTKQPLVLNGASFASLLQRASKVVVAPNRPLIFRGIDPLLFIDLVDGLGSGVNPQKQAYAVNQLLVPFLQSARFVMDGNVSFTLLQKEEKPAIRMLSDQQITIEKLSTPTETTRRHLWRQMMLQGVTTFSFNQGDVIEFSDVSEEDYNSIANDIKHFLVWSAAQLPENMTPIFDGSISVFYGTRSNRNSAQRIVQLTTNSTGTVTLKPKVAEWAKPYVEFYAQHLKEKNGKENVGV